MSEVLTERRGAVLLVTLNRPERLNAWVPALDRQYADALATADADPSVRAVVVTGAGAGFCAGADLEVLAGLDLESGPDLPARRLDAFPPAMRTPVIAAVNGACAGIGLVMALQCDVRFVSASARLATSFSRRGLIAEHGSSWLLPRLVGRGRALDLLLTGRTFDGEEAGRMGLAEFVLPRDEVLKAALAYATDLTENTSPTAMAVIKAQLRSHADLDLLDALRESDDLMLRAFARPDVREGLAAWREKRLPRFGDVDAAALDEVQSPPHRATPEETA